MNKITDVIVSPCTESKYIKPLRLNYKQNGSKKIWDAMAVHPGVSIVVFNKTRNVFVFVKQFRPAIYIASAKMEEKDGVRTVDTDKFPGDLGITYELCAGIVDKDIPPIEIAQEEVLEECGYKVPLDRIERITAYRSGVGTAGSLIQMFYAEVTDDMKVSSGGGLAEEGEMIDVIEVSVDKGKAFIMDESVNKPGGMMFGVMWFYDNKWTK